jgi:RNA polymerase sigma-B factor
MASQQRIQESDLKEVASLRVERRRSLDETSVSSLPASPGRGTGKPHDTDDINCWLQDYVALRTSPLDSGKYSPATLSALGDLKARIAGHYSGLVESIARRFVHTGEPFEDLVQEGFLGLLSALENYDPAKKVKFSTYSTHFIAGAIRHFLRDRGKIIKEPAWLHELYTKISRVSDSLTQRLGRPATSAEIAKSLNLTEEAVEELLVTRQVFQVAALMSGGSENNEDEMAGLVDPEKIRSDKYVTLQLPIEDKIVLEHAVDKLKALEQKVLYEFFYKDLNQTEIAKKFGISCNYVSHILKNSTKKLKRVLGEADVTDRGRSNESSIVDPVSGMFTAEHLLARVDEEISRSARGGQMAALFYLEMRGIPLGDAPALRHHREQIWKTCGDAVRRAIRRMDIAGRFEENSLLVFLPQTRPDVAEPFVARMENVLLAALASHGEEITVHVTVAFYPNQGRGTFDLIGAAREQSLFEQPNYALAAAA